MVKDIEFLYLEKGLIIVLLMVISFFTVFLFRRLKKKRLLFSFLRLVIFLLLLFLLLQPQYNIREKLTGRPVLAVLLDNSASMSLQDPLPRWQKIKTFFCSATFPETGQKISSPVLYFFG